MKKFLIPVWAAVLIFAVVIAGGCGKSDVAKPAVSQENIQAQLEKITSTKRGDGTENEAAMATYVEQTLKSYGYETEIQPFTFTYAAPHDDVTGNSQNVVAIKKADKADADILYITAHHDSISTTTGACDNASGLAAMLEVARISATQTDTEIRFVSFGAEESGRKGSCYYVDNLPQADKDRIIGDIQLDMLGHKDSTTLRLGTVDGQPTMLGNLINSVNKQKYQYHKDPNSDHAAFAKNQVPAVLFAQDASDMQNHNLADSIDTIDIAKLTEATQVISNVVYEIISPDTSSYLAEAKKINDYATAVPVMGNYDRIYFDMAPDFNDTNIGYKGKLVSSETDPDMGLTISVYSYNMKWFGLDKAVETRFIYLDDKLIDIEIDLAKEYSQAEISKTLTELYGDADQEEGFCLWSDLFYKRSIVLTPNGDSYKLEVGYYSGLTEELNVYTVKDGEIAGEADKQAAAVWEQTKKLLPAEGLKRITKLRMASDGIGNLLASMGPVEADTNNAEFCLTIDPADAFDPEGNFSNLPKLAKSIVHEYGHLLSWNDSQLKANPDVDWNGYKKGDYFDTAYIEKYYQAFWADVESVYGADYFKDADKFVSEYAETKMVEDFAESFCTFVMMEKPTGSTIAEQKVNFFYGFDEMTQARDHIRKAIGY